MQTMRNIILTMLILLSSCSGSTIDGNYKAFKEKYKKLTCYNLNEKILLQEYLSKNTLKSIDTNYLDTYRLIDKKYQNKEGIGITNLKDYKCKLLGIYEAKAFDCFITTSYSSQAGDGNEILLISTFKKSGEFIDSVKFDIQYRHDYDINPTQYFTMLNTWEMEFDNNLKYYEALDTNSTAHLKLVNEENNYERLKISNKGDILKK
jgi:hypothetical protein